MTVAITLHHTMPDRLRLRPCLAGRMAHARRLHELTKDTMTTFAPKRDQIGEHRCRQTGTSSWNATRRT